MIQLILSAPNPSDAAKFIGHIFSIMASTILDKLPPGSTFYSLVPFLVGLFEGEEDSFLLGLIDVFFPGDNPPLLNLFLCSYTKSTAC